MLGSRKRRYGTNSTNLQQGWQGFLSLTNLRHSSWPLVSAIASSCITLVILLRDSFCKVEPLAMKLDRKTCSISSPSPLAGFHTSFSRPQWHASRSWRKWHNISWKPQQVIKATLSFTALCYRIQASSHRPLNPHWNETDPRFLSSTLFG